MQVILVTSELLFGLSIHRDLVSGVQVSSVGGGGLLLILLILKLRGKVARVSRLLGYIIQLLRASVAAGIA